MKKTDIKKLLGNSMPRIRDYFITAAILMASCVIGIFLLRAESENYIQLIFVLAVVLVSRLTNGYLCGIIASLAGMFAVNYAFTYPYFSIDFSIAGYPVTFASFLLVSVIIGMLTTQLKQQSRIEAEMEKEKMRGNLLRAVSHDIRTPLTSVSGAASAILENIDKLGEKELLGLVKDIKDDADWLICMVENILTVTRIGEETGRINKNPEAAEEIISEAVMKFRKRYAVPVQINIPEELMMIPMDAILVEQVIVNLMENSVVHGDGTSLITLALSEENGFAVFRISDDGGGISEKMLPRLFDGYFMHASDNTGDSKRNMGIGLSVCMTIIKAHGGNMNGCNKNGGAEFTFTLPLE